MTTELAPGFPAGSVVEHPPANEETWSARILQALGRLSQCVKTAEAHVPKACGTRGEATAISSSCTRRSEEPLLAVPRESPGAA